MYDSFAGNSQIIQGIPNEVSEIQKESLSSEKEKRLMEKGLTESIVPSDVKSPLSSQFSCTLRRL
jgi:hypothetical protein